MATLLITDWDNGIVNKEFSYLLGFQPSLGGIVIRKNSINIFLDSRYHAKTASINHNELVKKSWKPNISFSLLKWNLIDALILECEESKSIRVEDNITLKYRKEIKQKSDTGSKYGSPKPEIIEPYFTQQQIIKTPIEKNHIKKAIEIIDQVFFYIQAMNLSGELKWLTEKQLRSIIINKIQEFWGEAESFDAIVAFWSNSAIAHHSAWDTRIEDGPLLIDMWAVYRKYCSDFTRTFWVWEKTPLYDEFQKVYESVKKAHKKAYKESRIWIEAKQIDALARESIAQDGYEEYFTHSTGHGVGLNIHEQPWINSSSTEMITPGMVFTIEPGIYLPGKFGVRLENIVFAEHNRIKCYSQVEL